MKLNKTVLMLSLFYLSGVVHAKGFFTDYIVEPTLNTNSSCQALKPSGAYLGTSFEILKEDKTDGGYHNIQAGYMLVIPNKKNTSSGFGGCAVGIHNRTNWNETFQFLLAKEPYNISSTPNWHAYDDASESDANAAGIKIFDNVEYTSSNENPFVDVMGITTYYDGKASYTGCFYRKENTDTCLEIVQRTRKEISKLLTDYMFVKRTKIEEHKITKKEDCSSLLNLQNKRALTAQETLDLHQCLSAKPKTVIQREAVDVYEYQEKDSTLRAHRLNCAMAILDKTVELLQKY